MDMPGRPRAKCDGQISMGYALYKSSTCSATSILDLK